MPARRQSPLYHSSRLLRALQIHWRLLVSFALFFVVRAGLTSYLDGTTDWLVAWDAAIACYLVLAFWLVWTADVDHIRRRAAVEDEGRFIILGLVALAALASLLAILAELGGLRSAAPSGSLRLRLWLTTATIFLSWALIHTVFAFHYAHEYYADDGDEPGGLRFEGAPPDYADFVYFSFVIGMTSQVSDVTITSAPIRHTATVHGILSFAFKCRPARPDDQHRR